MKTTRRNALRGVVSAALSWAYCDGWPNVKAGPVSNTGWLRSVKIGLHQAGWAPRPWQELFAAARKLGYDGVELAPPWLEEKHDLTGVYRLLVESGTALAPACFVGGQEMRDPAAKEAYLSKARKYARWMKAHGGKYVIYSTVSGAGARRTEQERKTIAEAFSRIADVVLRQGCTPLYHNHYVKNPHESRNLLREDLQILDWARWRLCVDTGHLVLALTDPVAFMGDWAEKVSWMHCKDVTTADAAELQRSSVAWQDRFTPLGTGVIDFPKVLEPLARTDFPGWLVVEQDKSSNPYETSKTSLAYLRRVLGEQ